MNSNFIDISETSSETMDSAREMPISLGATKVAKRLPTKILPAKIAQTGPFDAFCISDEPSLPKKSLQEMGFEDSKVDDWQKIAQPPKRNLFKLLKKMINDHIKPNIQIRIGGVIFNCHMMVLQCYSDFFMECSHEMLIEFPEEKVTPRAFVMIYEWMLAEKPLVQREGIVELFNAANFLRVKDLIDQCWLCLDDDIRFREDTAFFLYKEARVYGLESVQETMLSRICKFFLSLVASSDFLELNAKAICTLLSFNTICVNSEIEIFMSAVRWLSHDWEERESCMLDIIACVRFSLVPSWYLVMLIKSKECAEIEQIVSHPEVKKMINDGISFTSTQMSYADNHDGFLRFLERFKMELPQQRQWVFDKEWNQRCAECPNTQYITYRSFLEYLEMIQTAGKNYWRNLELIKGGMPCCFCSSCHKSDLLEHLKKSSREQGIQVEITSKQNGHQEGETIPSVQVEHKSSPRLSKAQVPNGKCTTDHCTENVNVVSENTSSGSSCSSQEYKDSPMSTSQNEAASDSLTDDEENVKRRHKTSSFSGVKVADLKKMAYQLSTRLAELNEPFHKHRKKSSASTSASDLSSEGWNTKLSKNRILLIFGGVDPYCQLCPHHEAYSRQVPNGCGNYFGGNGVNYGDHVLYCERDFQWKQLSHIPFGSRHNHAVVVCNGLIFIIGGTRTALDSTEKSVYEKAVWSVNVKNMKWTLECNLPEPRRDFGVVAIDDTPWHCRDVGCKESGIGFYIIGGEGVNGMALDSVWFYDVLQKKWTKKPSLNLGRYGLTAVRVNNEIWAGGGIINVRMECCGSRKNCVGQTTAIITDTVEYYCLKDEHYPLSDNCDSSQVYTNKWTVSQRRLRLPRLYSKFCMNAKKEIFLIGGIGIDTHNSFTSLSSVDRFDSRTGQWMHCGDLNVARHGHDAVLMKNHIIIIGGVSTITNCSLSSVERFNTKSLVSLTKVAELPWPISGCAAVVL